MPTVQSDSLEASTAGASTPPPRRPRSRQAHHTASVNGQSRTPHPEAALYTQAQLARRALLERDHAAALTHLQLGQRFLSLAPACEGAALLHTVEADLLRAEFRLGEAASRIVALLEDPGFLALSPEWQVRVRYMLANTLIDLRQGDDCLSMLEAATSALSVVDDESARVRLRFNQLNIALKGVAWKQPAFDGQADPLVLSPKGATAMRAHLADAVLVLEGALSSGQVRADDNQTALLFAGRAVAKAVGMVLPAIPRAAAVKAKGHRVESYVAAYWLAVADILNFRPRDAERRLEPVLNRGQLLLGQCDDHYLMYRAQLDQQRLLPAIRSYERHVALAAEIRTEWLGRALQTGVVPTLRAQGQTVEARHRTGADGDPWPSAEQVPELAAAVGLAAGQWGVGVSVSAMAKACGRSERSLRSAFVKHLGLAPKVYLDHLRLEGAHAQLGRGILIGQSLSAFAARWGWANSARFSAKYAQRFGERPLDTLRAARQRSAGTAPSRLESAQQ